MSATASTDNILVTQRPSDSNLQVALHPLVLLTISDHITRHQIRGHSGIIAGGLLGQQKGREITLEYAFECNVETDDQDGAKLQYEWFEDRLQQYKDVHKVPPLDLMGWYTLCPEDGPSPAFLPIHRQFLSCNESALFLAFHPSALAESTTANSRGKLPVTIYESFNENEPSRQDDRMQIDGEDVSGFKFRSIPYSFETGETEMIAVNYVAKGSGNAAAMDGQSANAFPGSERKDGASRKGKRRASEVPKDKVTIDDTEATTTASTLLLTLEEEDQIASMTTRLNSVRMLQSRLALLSTYITSITSTIADTAANPEAQITDQAHFPHLRNVKALIGRLSLLTPPHSGTTAATTTTFSSPESPTSPQAAVNSLTASETNPQTTIRTPLQDDDDDNTQLNPLLRSQQAQANDASLSTLLSVLGQGVQGLSEIGRKFSIVEQGKHSKATKKSGYGVGAGTGGSGGMGVLGGSGIMGFPTPGFGGGAGAAGSMDDSVMS